MTTTNGVSEWPPELVEARRALLDALVALEPHLDSLVLIGAQAIYLHTGTGTLVTPPSTTDADLALDADLLGEEPLIPSALQSAGFALGPHGQPGHWLNVRGIAVDLMVAPHQSGRRKGTARSASLPPHPRTTARIGPGLAAARFETTPTHRSAPSTQKAPGPTPSAWPDQLLCSSRRPSRFRTVWLTRHGDTARESSRRTPWTYSGSWRRCPPGNS